MNTKMRSGLSSLPLIDGGIMAETEEELAKDLGLVSALAIGIRTMVGAGIFVLPGVAAQEAGPAVVISFIIGGCIAMVNAFSVSELGTAMPKAGGAYYYINRALGPLAGSISGMGDWIGLAFASAFTALALAAISPTCSTERRFRSPPQDVHAPAGGRPGHGRHRDDRDRSHAERNPDRGDHCRDHLRRRQLHGRKGNRRHSDRHRHHPARSSHDLRHRRLLLVRLGNGHRRRQLHPEGTAAILPGAALVFVSYLGYAKIATVGEELKTRSKPSDRHHRQRRNRDGHLHDSRRALDGANSPRGVLPRDGRERADVLRGRGRLRLPASRRRLRDPASGVGVTSITLAALLATASSANASILASARINFAMGRDKIVSDKLSEIHPRFATPYRSIAVTGFLIIVFIIGLGETVEILSSAASVLHLVVYALINASLVVFRETNPRSTIPTSRCRSIRSCRSPASSSRSR